MQSPWIFVLFPLVGALIGYITNWLAVKMIFRPREQKQVLGIPLQGLIPRRRSELAENVARTVETDLLSVDTVQSLVTHLVEGEKMRALLHQRIDRLVSEQVNKLGPIVKNFIPKDLVPRLEQVIENEVILFIEEMSGELHDGIEEHLDIRELVRTRIEGFDLVRLEEIVARIAAKEFRHIEILGAILGALVGVVQAGLVQFLDL